MAAFGPEPWRASATPGAPTRLRTIRTRERALEVAARRCATAEAVEARLLEHASDWTEFCFDELWLSSREAANEALLCARDDGIAADELAARVRDWPSSSTSDRHDSLPLADSNAARRRVADQPFGPVALDGGWAVLWLRERRRPSLEDEALRADGGRRTARGGARQGWAWAGSASADVL